VTKNDLWDARVDTSQDPPMLQVDIPNRKWKGGTSSPPSYANPYPQPRCAAIIRLGAPAEDGVWQNIRAQGKVNEWRRQGDAGLMVVEGAGTVSAGYRFDLPPSIEATFEALKFRISGNAPAPYYINIHSRQNKEVVATGWIDSPPEEKEVSLPIPGHARGATRGGMGAIHERPAAPDALVRQSHLRLRGRVRRHFLVRVRTRPGPLQECQPTPLRVDAMGLHDGHGRDVGANSLVLSFVPPRLQVSRDRRAQHHRPGRAGLPGGPGDMVLAGIGKGLVPQHPPPNPASRLQFHRHVQRCQGGFLVSAEQKAGKIVKLEITSTVGGTLRVLHPWTGTLLERETQPAEIIEIRP